MFNHINHNYHLEQLEDITDDSGRRYVLPDGSLVPSVTTVLGSLSKPHIEAWKQRVGKEEADKVLAQASVRGTAVHQLAEDFINNKPDWNEGHMPSNLFTFASIIPIIKKNINNIYWQEAPLYSTKLRTAGRVDLVAEWQGELAIIDFKTSKRVKKKEDIENYFMQTAFYAAALYERTGLLAKKGVIIMAVDGEEPLVFVEKTYKWLPKFSKVRKQFDGE